MTYTARHPCLGIELASGIRQGKRENERLQTDVEDLDAA